ncbi:hypothetical protein J3R30DRAFT_3701534 [Lentinula aciculospora]|uniref:Polymerase nucleotidyl transferase domain-containing protein n=1 Tax=Lentinula aciculospora TaxID=153920 RepID=A0A9W9DQJ3_9AGAR|nr:hypothetical protein J3R30DRAFT_3701534 [Lentinula aciculospora]
MNHPTITSSNLTANRTGLVLIPPKEITERLDQFRLVHDKSALRWTAHITLHFSFNEVPRFPEAVATIEQGFSQIEPFSFKLDGVGSFILPGYETTGRPLTLHLTVGQAAHNNSEALSSLRRKAQKLLDSDEDDGGAMKPCYEIFLAGELKSRYVCPSWFQTVQRDDTTWKFCGSPSGVIPSSLSIATYNILHDDHLPIYKRLPSIVPTILTSNVDITVLQETTDDSIPAILSESSIYSLFPFSRRHPDVVLENKRNILVLSRFPLSWSKLDIGGKHKPAFVASFLNPPASMEPPFVLAATHLTAAAGLVVPHGPTFDPSTNSLPAATMWENSDPQRYDRIYVKKNSGWDVKSTRLFGNGDDPSSDHYGLTVILRRRVTSARKPDVVSEAISHLIAPVLLPTGRLSTTELAELSIAQSWLPSSEQEQKMSVVGETLRSLVCPSVHDLHSSTTSTSTVQVRIECVGSYALGVHTSTSDVDCLAVGNVSSSTFWDLAKSRIRQNENAKRRGCGVDVRLRGFVKDAIVQMMDLDVGGVKVDMQYCPARNLVGEEWKNIRSLPSDSPLFFLPVSSLITLNAYRDVLTLLKVRQPPSLLSALHTAHRAIKLFLVSRGLFGARFGFLGGFHLTLLLTRVTLT